MPDSRPPSLLRRVVDVAPGEGVSLAWSGLWFFAVLAGAFVLRPLRDQLGLAGGADQYPWLFTGTLVAMLGVNAPFAWLVTRFPRRRFIPLVYRASAACLLGFFAVFEALPAWRVPAAYAFFIWFSVFNLLVVSVFRGFMADIWGFDQAKRLFGVLGLGGTVGALAGSWLANVLARPVGSTRLILLAVVFLEIAVLAARRLFRRHHVDETGPRAIAAGGDLWRGLRLVLELPYLRLIAGYIFLYGLLGTFLYFQQGKLVESSLADADARTAYFAAVEFWVQAGTIVVQFFLTARLIRWFGTTFALVSQPVAALLGTLAVAVALWQAPAWAGEGLRVAGLVPELLVLAVVQVVLRISNFATAQPAREALYTVVEREVKYKSKGFIDTFVYRLGDSTGAWVFLGILKLNVALAGLALLAAPVAAGWVWLGRSLGGRQREMAGDRGDRGDRG